MPEENNVIVANTLPELDGDTVVYLKTGVYNDYPITLSDLAALIAELNA